MAQLLSKTYLPQYHNFTYLILASLLVPSLAPSLAQHLAPHFSPPLTLSLAPYLAPNLAPYFALFLVPRHSSLVTPIIAAPFSTDIESSSRSLRFLLHFVLHFQSRHFSKRMIYACCRELFSNNIDRVFRL